jgi:hypothetical protein
MKAVVLALLSAASLSVFAGDADEVARLDKEISVATWAGDAVWFEEHLADEYVLITPTGALRGKRDVIRELANPLRMEPFEPTEVQIRMFGETAIATGRMLQRFTLGGIRFANDLRYTDVYIKRKGRWLLASAHVSSVASRR